MVEPEIGDAFGAALVACHEAGETGVFSVVERDDGWLAPDDMGKYFATAEAWWPVERWLCDMAGERVLDIGAGAGRHALYLRERGHEVTAVDASPGAVAVCQRRGLSAVIGSAAQPHVQRVGRVDSALMLGHNLALLGSRETAPGVLSALADVLKPGGSILATCRDPYDTRDPDHLRYHERNRSMGRMGGQVRMRIRFARLATDWFDYLFLSPAELESILNGTAWAIADLRADGHSYGVRLTSRG